MSLHLPGPCKQERESKAGLWPPPARAGALQDSPASVHPVLPQQGRSSHKPAPPAVQALAGEGGDTMRAKRASALLAPTLCRCRGLRPSGDFLKKVFQKESGVGILGCCFFKSSQEINKGRPTGLDGCRRLQSPAQSSKTWAPKDGERSCGATPAPPHSLRWHTEGKPVPGGAGQRRPLCLLSTINLIILIILRIKHLPKQSPT